MFKSMSFALLSLLLVLLGGASCMKEVARLVAVHDLHYFLEGPSNYDQFSSLKTTSRNTENAAVLELKHQISSSVRNFHENLFHADEARVSSLQSRIKSHFLHLKQSEARIPLTSGLALQTLNYVVSIKIGGEDVSVIVDTGSDLTWVQCKPCTYCYLQHNPLYDPSTSPTYHLIPCNSTLCTSLLPSAGTLGTCGPDRPACGYAVRYGDGSYTRGVLAQERISFGETCVEEFIFGCGQSNRGLFGRASGLVGLGRTGLSLVSQTRGQFGEVFSYCLPSRVNNASGDLILGDLDPSGYKNDTPITFTRLVQVEGQAPFYFLNLTSMSVGGVELRFSKGARVLIDSGTVITRLAPSLYNTVRDEFVKQFSRYPTALGYSILDTCYDLSKYEEVGVPKLKLGFDGEVNVNVDVTGILYVVKKDASQVCLAMTSLAYEDGIGIIGNYQQKNQRIVYDNVGARVGFGEEKCGYN